MKKHSLIVIALFLLLSAVGCLEDNNNNNNRHQGSTEPGPIALANPSFEATDLGDQERLALHPGWEYLQLLSVGPLELAYVVRVQQEDFETPFDGLVDGGQALAFFPRPVDYMSFLSTTSVEARAGEAYEFEIAVMVPRDAVAPSDVALGLFNEPRTPITMEWIEVPEPGEVKTFTLSYVVPEGAAGETLRPGFLAFHEGDEDATIYFDNARFERLPSQQAPAGLLNADFEFPELREGLFTYGAPGWKAEQLNYFGVAHHDDTILPAGAVQGNNILEIGVRAPETRSAFTYPFAQASGGESFDISFQLNKRSDVIAPDTIEMLLKVDEEVLLDETVADLNDLEGWQSYSYCVTVPTNITGPVRFGFAAARSGEDDQIQRLLLDDLQIQARNSACD